MSRVSFSHAFQRWYKMTDEERARLDAEKKDGGTILSWEALDHLCGLAVESGMKALMIKEKWVTAEKDGDYPRHDCGQRPHVNELWEIFIGKAKGRKAGDWVAKLGGKHGAPVSAFAEWRAEHRYAEDGTVSEATVRARLAMAARVKHIAQEEGIL